MNPEKNAAERFVEGPRTTPETAARQFTRGSLEERLTRKPDTINQPKGITTPKGKEVQTPQPKPKTERRGR